MEYPGCVIAPIIFRLLQDRNPPRVEVKGNKWFSLDFGRQGLIFENQTYIFNQNQENHFKIPDNFNFVSPPLHLRSRRWESTASGGQMGLSRDMVRRSDQFQMHGLMRAFNDAQPAAHAFFMDNKGLHLLGARHFSHLNGFEGTPFHAGLTALAFLGIDDRPEATGLHYLMQHTQIDSRLDRHAAAGTAVTESGYTQIDLVPGLMEQPFIRRLIH